MRSPSPSVPAAPGIAPLLAASRPARRNFLADVVIDYGPADVLSRLFLRADTELRQRGLNMTFTSFEELVAINKANSGSWHPLVSVFDPVIGGASNENGFVLIGCNAAGEAVTAFAARNYRLASHTLKDEIESLRLFYADPERSRNPGEHIEVTAPTAATTRGNAVYIGGVWFRPDYRGQGLHRVMSPITRAMSYTRWGADIAFSLMVSENVTSGVARSARFPHVEWGATWTNSPVFGDGTLELALVWTNADEQLRHFAEYVGEAPQRAGTAGERGSDRNRMAG
jgi:hypothetical protein